MKQRRGGKNCDNGDKRFSLKLLLSFPIYVYIFLFFLNIHQPREAPFAHKRYTCMATFDKLWHSRTLNSVTFWRHLTSHNKLQNNAFRTHNCIIKCLHTKRALHS